MTAQQGPIKPEEGTGQESLIARMDRERPIEMAQARLENEREANAELRERLITYQRAMLQIEDLGDTETSREVIATEALRIVHRTLAEDG